MTDQERIAALEQKTKEQAVLISAVTVSNNGAVRKVNEHSETIKDLDARVSAVEKGVVVPTVPTVSAWQRVKTFAGRFLWPPFKIFAPGTASSAALVGLLLMMGTLTAPGCHGPEPVPPAPVPIPVPPVPPTPPAPIPLPGLRVLIMYDKDTLTDAQQGIVFGAQVRAYLDTKCVIGPDGKTPERRIYASGVDATGEVQWIRDVIQRHPGQKAFMVVSDGKTGYDGVLPANADEAMKILTKIGG